jgi:hypothetical protein
MESIERRSLESIERRSIDTIDRETEDQEDRKRVWRVPRGRSQLSHLATWAMKVLHQKKVGYTQQKERYIAPTNTLREGKWKGVDEASKTRSPMKRPREASQNTRPEASEHVREHRKR